jgi:hypothetical protein
MSERLTEEQLRHEMQRIERDRHIAALRARVAQLEAALVEVGDFLADDCVENYPFDRIPGSFADEADRLLKLIKVSVRDAQ